MHVLVPAWTVCVKGVEVKVRRWDLSNGWFSRQQYLRNWQLLSEENKNIVQ